MMRKLRSLTFPWTLAALCGALLPGCHRPAASQDERPPAPPWFADVTEKSGLRFVHDAGPVDDHYFMPQVVGSGAALFDFDGDGRLDLYLLHNGGPEGQKNRLYRQLPDSRFQDCSAGSGLDVAGHNMGVAVGDADNDGRPDVLLTQFGGVRLFRNEGGGKFRDVTAGADISVPLWFTSAAFVDYDRDGWLDLVVVAYVDYDRTWPCTSATGDRDYCAPKPFKGTASKLYRNLGRQAGGGIRFRDVSLEAGLGRKPGPGLGIVCADFDGDGWPDILIANDGEPNCLWMNQRDGTFKEEAVMRGIGYNAMGRAEANMGIGLGDVDGDGLQDIFVTHLGSETNTLWKQGPRGIFRDATADSALARPNWRATGFGTVLGDFDRDGALDAALVNGRVAKQAAPRGSPLGPFWGQYGERNQLFANDGSGRFRDISPDNPALCGYDQIGRGLAMGVLDNDSGSLDLVVTCVAGPVRLLRNVTPNPGHWLLVRVIEPARGGRDALGAEISVRAGDRRWVRTAQSAGSYVCSNDPRAHFGLGDVDRLDALQVVWPDGRKEDFPPPPVDRLVVLRKGAGRPGK